MVSYSEAAKGFSAFSYAAAPLRPKIPLKNHLNILTFPHQSAILICSYAQFLRLHLLLYTHGGNDMIRILTDSASDILPAEAAQLGSLLFR